MDWTPTKAELPEERRKLEWLSPNTGKPIEGYTFERLWYVKGDAQYSDYYVYYTPQFWRYK